MDTKLERFRKQHGVAPKLLSVASGLSPKTVELIRKGHNTTLESAKALALAFSKLLGRDVQVVDLFDLSVSRKKSKAA